MRKENHFEGYRAVAERLSQAREIYLWANDASEEDVLPIDDRSRPAVEALGAARGTGAAGLAARHKIVEALS